MTVDPSTLKHSLILTPREEKIILIKYIVHSVSPFYDAPLETRIKMLQAAAEICGYPYDDEEWQEIGRSILATQEKINTKLAASLYRDKDLYKTVMSSLKDGNDEIIKKADLDFDKNLKKFLGK